MLNKVKKHDYSGPTQEPETMYNIAKQEWFGIIGSAMEQKKDWKRFAYALLIVTAISIIGNIYLASKPKVIPYIIEVNTEDVTVTVAKLNAKKDYKPREEFIKKQISTFVEYIQTVSTDQVVIQKNLLKAYDMIAQKGYDLLSVYIREKRKPFALSETKAITVENIVINKITDDSYQVDWTEEEYTIGSQKKPVIMNYTGTFTIEIKQPETDEMVLKNPLGINIQQFHVALKFQVK